MTRPEAVRSDEAAPVPLSQLCLDPSRPPEVRARLLLDALNSNSEEPDTEQTLLTELIRGANAGVDAETLRLMESYEQGLAELTNGPVRPATYLGPADCDLPAPQP